MMVKDSEGGLGTLATRRELHRDTAAEGFKFYLVEDISNHWKIQDELHLMDSENKVPDGSEDHIVLSWIARQPRQL